MAHDSWGRDDFMRIIFEDDFCEQNPLFASHKEELLACREAYRKSATNSTCRCGGNPRVAFDCMDNVLAKLTAFQTENPEAVTAFVTYAGVKRNNSLTSITIYYRKSSEFPLQKFRFS